MKYVLLNPSGNLTCLVLSPVAEADRPRITGLLMNRCEQVGYLMPSSNPACAARLRMMGDEFCGNASMAAAAWLISQHPRYSGEEAELLLEVSGAADPVTCLVKQESASCWSGRVRMPAVLGSEPCSLGGRTLEAIHLPGMTHLIAKDQIFSPGEAEALLQEAAALFPDPAAGLIRWKETSMAAGNGIRGEMTPLVYVRESATMVWESACGSGTAAAAWLESLHRKAPLELTLVQPGGTLTARTEYVSGKPGAVWLQGTVHLGVPETLAS